MRRFIAGSLLALLLGAGAAQADLITFVVSMDGSQEVPGPGDPDGTGTATVTIDDVALTVDWEFTYENILTPLTAAHIHVGDPGESGSPVVDFSGQDMGTGLFDSDLAAVLANPGGYYVNLHNADFPSGAIRGQLPEPGALALLVAGAMAASLRGKRTRSS